MIHFCFGNGNSRKDLDLNEYKQHGTVVGCNAVYRDFTPDILVALDSRMGHEIYRCGYAHKNTTYLGYWTPIPTEVAETILDTETGPVSLSPSDLGFTNQVVYHGADGVFTFIEDKNVKGITYITGTVEGDKAKNIEPNIDGFAYSTGTRSIHLSCELGATEVYIIGYDLYSTDDKINNIYAGTRCYAEADADLANPDNPEKDDLHHWIKQHKNTFDTFKDTKFYKVNPNPIGTSPIDIEIEEWKDCENLEYITFAELNNKFLPF